MKVNQKNPLLTQVEKSVTRAQDTSVDEDQELCSLFSMPEESVPLCNFSFWVKSE